MNLIFKVYYLFFFSIFFLNSTLSADSTKIYKKHYENPINTLNTFLWNDKSGGYIGLAPKFQITNRNLNNTIHPVSIEPSKIKIALSKLKYKDDEDELLKLIFTYEDLDILSKNFSRGLLVANNFQDIIFEIFANKKKDFLKKNLIRTSKGIFFVEKNTLNLIFFELHECKKIIKSEKKGFYRRSQIFPKKHKQCKNSKKTILVSSNSGIYKKKTNPQFNWLIFTSKSLELNSMN